MKLSVHLVTWNGERYIPFLFASLRNQSFKDWELYVLDNNSTDETVELIKKELNNFPVKSRLILNSENKGFAGGHNQLYSQTNSEYFVLLNQDFYVAPDCLEKLVKELDAHQEIAVVGPRLMKWDFAEATNDLQKSFTNIVDSLGLKVFRNRRVVEIGAGEIWKTSPNPLLKGGGQFVFGVSGAMPMFRTSVIRAITFSNTEFFDSTYGSYKEDVDLAFRLQSAGYQALVIVDAVTYHDRSAAGPSEMSDVAAAKNKKNQSTWVKYHSNKNQLMTLYKNEYWQNFLLDFPWIIWYELKKWTWFLLFDWRVLKGHREIWKVRKDLKIKRLKIKRLRKVSWREMRKWWN